MSYFGEFQRSIRESIAVWYLGQKYIGTFLEAVGLVLDGSVDGLIRGLRLSQPLRCDTVAFGALSKDRKRKLYPNEPEASKRERLRKWRQLARSEACHYGAMINLAPYFLPGTPPKILIAHQSGDPGGGAITTWHIYDPSLPESQRYSWYRPAVSNFNYDGQTAKWSRWFCYIDLSGTGIAPPNTYDDGHKYDDGAVYDSPYLTPAKTSDIVNILLDSNAPHMHLSAVVLTWTPIDITAMPVQDVTGWWSLPNGKWGSTIDSVTHLGTRPPYMIWLYDQPG